VLTIVKHNRYLEQFDGLRLSTLAGIMFCGLPYCSKTLLAKAIVSHRMPILLARNKPKL